MSRERGDGEALGCLALAVLLVVGFVGLGLARNGSEETCTSVVTDKDRAKDQDGHSDMRIYTDDCGVLRVKDELWVGQLDSADIYAHIKVGKTYTFTTRGWRVPWLSQFPNIVKAEEQK